MKVTALSDAHTLVSDLEISPTDVLIYAGDWSGRGAMAETSKFVYWMEKQPAKHKIVVAGNHDIFAEENQHLMCSMCKYAGIRYLKDEELVIDGKRFFGSPWSVEFGGWAFGRNEEWLENAYRRMPFNLDVLITHGPPKGILDLSYSTHIGSQALMDRILLTTPKNVIFGHNHTKGKTVITQKSKEIVFYNVSMMNNDYEIVNEPTVFEI